MILKGLETVRDIGRSSVRFCASQEGKELRIQVKLQRKEAGGADEFSERKRTALHKALDQLFCVEVRKTRSGETKGKATRPSHFGDFDILAVNLHPSTDDWRRFIFTPGKWLLPREKDPELIEIFQPVPQAPDSYWTDDLETCVKWYQDDNPRTLYK